MKTIGIIGGMGPLATVDLYRKIVVMTDAKKDQDHPHVIVDGNTRIPDRTAAILADGEDPAPQLIASAKRLEAAGADILIMACNTAHYFYDIVISAVRIPGLHMPHETMLEIMRLNHKKAALLATDGTIQTQIYHKVFRDSGICLVTPDNEGQKEVMSLIYDGVKAGCRQYNTRKVTECLAKMQDAGVEIFILGCTELPLAFEAYGISAPCIDPSSILAKAAIKKAGYAIKKNN